MKEMKFPEVLKKIRKDRGLTIRELSNICEYSTAYICDLEQGNRKVTIDFIKKLSKSLKIEKEERDILLNAYTYDRYNVSPELMNYIIDNDLLDSLNVLKELDSEGKYIKELANKLKNNKVR